MSRARVDFSMPHEFLMCRDLMHKWYPNTVRRMPGHTIERDLGCENCGATKTQVLDRRGFIVRTKMTRYPEGYLREPGAGRMTAVDRAQLRLYQVGG